MAEEPIPELRLKPSALRRHDPSRIRNRHQLFDAGRKQRKGARILPLIDHPFELRDPPNTAHEINSRAGAWVVNVKNWFQSIFLEQSNIELLDGIGGRDKAGAKM